MPFRTLLLFFIAFSAAVQAQNWELFPLDSLRCYEALDANGNAYLKGMDYRSYLESNGETIIHLDSFSKARFIPYDFNKPRKEYLEYLYLTGNSVFGKSINVTDGVTTMYFVNDSIRSIVEDSILFVANTAIGEQWPFYQNDSIVISAKIERITLEQIPIGLDSVRHIKLESFSKTNPGIKFTNFITYSKNFGMLKTLDFDGLRKFNFQNSFEDTINLLDYKEYTAADFFEVKPGTISHGQRTTGDWYNHTVYHTYTSYYEQDNSLFYDQIKLQQETTSAGGTGPWVGDTILKVMFLPEMSGDTIFNPIPNSYNYGKYRVENLCGGNKIRVRTSDSYKYIKRVSIDSIGLNRELSDIALIDFTESYVNGVGLESSFYRSGLRGIRYFTKNLTYIKTPTCIVGTPSSNFVSVQKVNYRNLQVYPNPVQSTLHIKNTILNGGTALVYNTLGLVFSYDVTSNTIDLRNLTSGVYFLEISSGTITYRTKFIKE